MSDKSRSFINRIGTNIATSLFWNYPNIKWQLRSGLKVILNSVKNKSIINKDFIIIIKDKNHK